MKMSELVMGLEKKGVAEKELAEKLKKFEGNAEVECFSGEEFNELFEEKKQFFWLDGWVGDGKGGFFVRNPLKEFVERLEKNGMRMVGIVYDGSYNLEIIVDKKSCVEAKG